MFGWLKRKEAPASPAGTLRELLFGDVPLAAWAGTAAIGPWEGDRPPLARGQARLSLLTPSGLHYGQAPFGALSRDALAAPAFGAATALMLALTKRASRPPGGQTTG